jgi:hypothetical protein
VAFCPYGARLQPRAAIHVKDCRYSGPPAPVFFRFVTSDSRIAQLVPARCPGPQSPAADASGQPPRTADQSHRGAISPSGSAGDLVGDSRQSRLHTAAPAHGFHVRNARGVPFRLPCRARPTRNLGQTATQRHLVRSRGLEPPRVAPLAPQASASTTSATTAGGLGNRPKARRRTRGPFNKSVVLGQGRPGDARFQGASAFFPPHLGNDRLLIGILQPSHP